MISPKYTPPSNFQRVQDRAKNFKKLKKDVNDYVGTLDENKKVKLNSYYKSNDTNFIGINTFVMPAEFCTPIGNALLKSALLNKSINTDLNSNSYINELDSESYDSQSDSNCYNTSSGRHCYNNSLDITI